MRQVHQAFGKFDATVVPAVLEGSMVLVFDVSATVLFKL